jgi:hypothetical protein
MKNILLLSALYVTAAQAAEQRQESYENFSKTIVIDYCVGEFSKNAATEIKCTITHETTLGDLNNMMVTKTKDSVATLLVGNGRPLREEEKKKTISHVMRKEFGESFGLAGDLKRFVEHTTFYNPKF